MSFKKHIAMSLGVIALAGGAAVQAGTELKVSAACRAPEKYAPYIRSLAGSFDESRAFGARWWNLSAINAALSSGKSDDACVQEFAKQAQQDSADYWSRIKAKNNCPADQKGDPADKSPCSLAVQNQNWTNLVLNKAPAPASPATVAERVTPQAAEMQRAQTPLTVAAAANLTAVTQVVVTQAPDGSGASAPAPPAPSVAAAKEDPAPTPYKAEPLIVPPSAKNSQCLPDFDSRIKTLRDRRAGDSAALAALVERNEGTKELADAVGAGGGVMALSFCALMVASSAPAVVKAEAGAIQKLTLRQRVANSAAFKRLSDHRAQVAKLHIQTKTLDAAERAMKILDRSVPRTLKEKVTLSLKDDANAIIRKRIRDAQLQLDKAKQLHAQIYLEIITDKRFNWDDKAARGLMHRRMNEAARTLEGAKANAEAVAASLNKESLFKEQEARIVQEAEASLEKLNKKGVSNLKPCSLALVGAMSIYSGMKLRSTGGTQKEAHQASSVMSSDDQILEDLEVMRNLILEAKASKSGNQTHPYTTAVARFSKNPPDGATSEQYASIIQAFKKSYQTQSNYDEQSKRYHTAIELIFAKILQADNKDAEAGGLCSQGRPMGLDVLIDQALKEDEVFMTALQQIQSAAAPATAQNPEGKIADLRGPKSVSPPVGAYIQSHQAPAGKTAH